MMSRTYCQQHFSVSLKPIVVILMVINTFGLYGQAFTIVHLGTPEDSSYYHLARISENEFWAGGEYGILSRIDSFGNLERIEYSPDSVNILEIERYKNKVYIATDNAVIYRYDLTTGKTEKKEFRKFGTRCFYDMMVMSDGKLLVCGGHSGIADGLKKIPHGFIAEIDFEAGKVNYQWRGIRKFAWSLAKNNENEVYVSIYDGMKSKIWKQKTTSSGNKYRWKKSLKGNNKIKGLIHEIAFFNNELWYSGTKTMRYYQDGIIGKVKEGKEPLVCKGNGCIWSMDYSSKLGSVFGLSQKGEVIIPNTKTNSVKKIRVSNAYALYDSEKISESKYLLVGHGKGAFLMYLR